MPINLNAVNDDSEGDEDLDKGNYERLLKNIGINLEKTQAAVHSDRRTEPSKNVSLFSISQTDKKGRAAKLKLHQLMTTVKKSSSVNKLKIKIDKVELPSEQLSAPLPKPIADRIQRKVEYKKTSDDVSKWDQIVKKHRKAEHISFPLNQEPFQIKTVNAYFKPKSSSLTPLEKEMYALLSNNEYAERPGHDLTIKEEEALASMSLMEAKERLAELRKHRALLSYQQARNHRQKKIKSKNYRRMVRKQKAKAAKKLPGYEEDSTLKDLRRAEERASLRHHSGSKWAKKIKRIAKHNESTKSLIDEQKQKRSELLKKRIQAEETDEDESDSTDLQKSKAANYLTNDVLGVSLTKNNPWLSTENKTMAKDKHILDEGVDDYFDNNEKVNGAEELSNWLNNQISNQIKQSKPSSDKKKFEKALGQLSNIPCSVSNDKSDKQEIKTDEVYDAPTADELIETANKFADLDEMTPFQVSSSAVSEKEDVKSPSMHLKTKANSLVSRTVQATSLDLQNPTLIEENNSSQQKLSIEEAFADDDVMAEFQEEINEATKSDEENDLSIPGWGSWAGSGIIKRKRKKRKSPYQKENRKDLKLGHVILNEKRDAYITKHQVHQLPFPFNKRDHFENYIAKPIGSTWNTPEAFSAAIKPSVSVPIGTIVPPMDSNKVFSKNEKQRKH